MRAAIIDSRSLEVQNLRDYLPEETAVIASGGACSVDTSVRTYAIEHDIPLLDFFDRLRKIWPVCAGSQKWNDFSKRGRRTRILGRPIPRDSTRHAGM